MTRRSGVSWPYLLLPGALIVACGSDPATPPVTDAGRDGATDVPVSTDTAVDAGTDVTPQTDAPVDVKTPPDVPSATDAGDDVPVGADVPPADDVPVGADVPPADDVPVTPDVPPSDDVPVGVDVPAPTDVPVGVDVPAPIDVPVTPDVPPPPVDVPVMPDVPPPPVDVPVFTCGLPLQRALMLPTDRITGSSTAMSRIATSTCAGVGGPEVIYPVRITARTGLSISTSGTAYDTVLMIRRTCDVGTATSEIACNDDAPGGNASYIRRIFDPGDYFVVVDQYGGADGRGGMYTLDVSAFTPAANAECAGALALTPGTPLMGNVQSGNGPSTACLADQWGPQLFYTVTIPAGQRATITATPSGTPAWRAVVRAQTTCMTDACITNGTAAAAGADATEVLDNRGTAPLTVTLSVASSSGPTGGAFTLNAALTALPVAPPNATCTMARDVADGTTFTGDDPGTGITRLNGVCLGGAQGTSLYYRATVPARSTLVFTATPTSAWNPAIRLLNSCTATACVASSDTAGASAAETLRWTNTSASPSTVFVAVSSVSATTAGPFNGAVRILPPPTNNVCAAATAVMSGTALAGQNSAAGSENLTGPCLATATGTVLYYSVLVPAGQQVTTHVHPVAGVDPTIRVLDACGAATCAASANATGAGADETLAFTNTGATDHTYIVAVGGATNATNGAYDVDFNVRREYSETSVPRACDDMTGGTPLTGLSADDSVTGLIDLPFAFRFYGESELEYSVSSNGLVQLWPTLMGTPTASFDNVAIPRAAAPNRFIAALWDDLLPVNMVSSTLTRVLGTSPARRFVIQWTNFAIFGDDRARLTFQAKLFEGSNAIELHYCTLTPGAMTSRAAGDSATVGIEGPAGDTGRQHSFNAAMSVSTASAIRFAP